MSSLFARIGGCEDKVSKYWAMLVVKKRNEHIRAFAGGNSWARKRLALAYENRQSGIFARVPIMNVSGGFGYDIRLNERNIMVIYVADNVSCRAAEAVAQCIVQ